MDKVIIESCPVCLKAKLLPFLNVTDYRASKESFALVQCATCGLVITQNQPAESEIGRYYETEDYISHSESGRSLMDRVYYAVRKYMAQKKRSWLERLTTGRQLIDIGAGTGYFTAYMKKRGWTVRGIEPSPQAREIAFRTHALQIEDVDALFRLPSSSTDVVTMWHVMEHVHSPEKYLRRIHEILNEKGILFLALPNYISLDAAFYQAHWGAWDVPRHLWHFSPGAVRLFLDRCGFKLAHVYTLPFDAFYVAQVSEKYRGGGLWRMLRGLIVGKCSFLKSLFHKEKASSVVYVCRK